MKHRTLVSACAWLCSALGAASAAAQMSSATGHAAIAYEDTAPNDPIARLQERIDAGEVQLDFDESRGYLAAVLRHLAIPTSSQGFVFSRTSLQVDRITPWSPRAVYFNDDVYVGWVQRGPVLEFASVDPVLGAVFYTLDQVETDEPRFRRETGTCLMCHDSGSITGGVPGFIVRSVYPDRYGYAITAQDRATTDRTPFSERWGGWYVTGTHGSQKHLGNAIAPDLTHEVGNARAYVRRHDFTTGGNVTDLSGRFNTDAYLSPHSDIVALLVLTHQANVHNLITRAQYAARRAIHDEALLLGPVPEGGEHQPLTVARIEQASEPLVRAMLFVNEAPLEARVEGTSSFADDFESLGPFDDEGRSLRQLDLERRLFRYPLSFLVYTESFDALPDVVRRYVYRRFRDVLSGADATEDFGHLSVADKKAILEILSATKDDFAGI